MRVIVKPFPVLYACQGCPEFGQTARDVGAFLDRGGFAEMIWLGASRNSKPTQRFPIFALDGCAKACARRWLAEHGVAAQRSYVLGDHCAERIAAELVP
jgi:uncharacterized metal-binding protein